MFCFALIICCLSIIDMTSHPRFVKYAGFLWGIVSAVLEQNVDEMAVDKTSETSR